MERLKHRGKNGTKNSKYIRKEDAYSLKYIIVSNACSFMVGIGLASIGYGYLLKQLVTSSSMFKLNQKLKF